MRDLTQRSSDRTHHAGSAGSAISAFLYLGEQLAPVPSSGKPASPKGTPVPTEAAQALLRAIEGDIIPRLLLAHRAWEAEAPAPAQGAALTADDHAKFLDLVLTDTAASTRGFVAELLRRGASQEVVFLELLSTAARRLGELWEEDRCSFSEVTIGLCRLHEVLREHSTINDALPGRHAPCDGPRILLATACADQHVFGVVMVAEFFRRAGWRVWSEPGALRDQLAAIVADQSFDVLGLSANYTAIADDVANEIEILRKASRNTRMLVLVGGHLFLDAPELVASVGADGSACDARTAPALATRLLARPGAKAL